MSVHLLSEMFPDQIEARLAERPVLVLPFGTIEWHSHHLPVGLDGLVAAGLAHDIADRSDAVLAPVSYWAVGGVPYPFTLNLPIAVVEPLLLAVLEQFAAMRFGVVVAFTGHFGLDQTLALKRAAVTVMERSPVTILALTEYDLVTDTYGGDHAGPGETSLLWALRPDLVRLDAVDSRSPLDGVIGDDPRGRASRERGEELAELIASRTAAVVDRMLRATTPLQRRQYIEALAAAVRVLEDTSRLRTTQPKSSVPPLATPSYLRHCSAIMDGDYRAAQRWAEQKRSDLSQ